MKKLSFFIMLLTIVTLGSAQAQGGRQGQGQRQTPEEMAERTANLWQENFGLSDEQYKKVYDLLLKNQKDTRAKMEELRASGDREAMRSMMEEQRTAVETEVKKIFTEQQWAAFEQWKKDNPPQQRRRRGGGK